MAGPSSAGFTTRSSRATARRYASCSLSVASPSSASRSTRRTARGRGELLGDKNRARVPVLELDDGRDLAESNAIPWYSPTARRTSRPILRAAKSCSGCSSSSTSTSRRSPSPASGRCSVTGGLPDREARRERGYRALDRDGASISAGATVRRRRLHDRRHLALRVHARGGGRRLRLSGYPRSVVARARRGGAGPHHDRRLTVSVAQLRRFLVAYQGYATVYDVEGRRSRREILRLSAVQLDSISTVDRATG